MALHLIKLCVGCDTVEDLLAWRLAAADAPGDVESATTGRPWILRTRQTPKRAAEMLDGGSLYRVFKGLILARQPIVAVETVGEGVAKRCEITLADRLILTRPAPRRPFQGWRYLEPADAPPDLAGAEDHETIPADLARRLSEVGAW